MARRACQRDKGNLASEDNDSVQPLFERVIEMYGKPGAVISDMQPAFIKSVENRLPDVLHQYCQQHFLTNAGGFMLDEEQIDAD